MIEKDNNEEVIDLHPDEIEVQGFNDVVKQDNVLNYPTILNSIMRGTTILAGSGDNCFKFDKQYGLWLGNTLFSDAPFSVDMAGNIIADSIVVSKNIAGENLSKNDAVFIASIYAPYWEIINQHTQNSYYPIWGEAYVGQTFLLTKSCHKLRISLWLERYGTASGFFNVRIYDVDDNGLPTGWGFAETNISGSDIDTTAAEYDFELGNYFDGNKQYAIICKYEDGSSGHSIDVYYNSAGGYSGGNRITNSGDTWTARSDDLYFIAQSKLYEGKLFKTSSDYGDERTQNFVGFAREDVNAEEEAMVQTIGILDIWIGTLYGIPWYLSGTEGSLSSGAGDYPYKVGISLSSGKLLIKPERTKRNIYLTDSSTHTASIAARSNDKLVTITCGFMPKKIYGYAKAVYDGSDDFGEAIFTCDGDGNQQCHQSGKSGGEYSNEIMFNRITTFSEFSGDRYLKIINITKTGFDIQIYNTGSVSVQVNSSDLRFWVEGN